MLHSFLPLKQANDTSLRILDILQSIVSYCVVLWLDFFSQCMFTKILHVVACANIEFPFMVAPQSMVWIQYILFIHSSVDGHSIYFQVLAIMNKAAMNIYVQVLLWTYIFNFYQKRIVEQYGNSTFKLLKKYQPAFQVRHTTLQPHQMWMKAQILHIYTNTATFCPLALQPSWTCKVVSPSAILTGTS